MTITVDHAPDTQDPTALVQRLQAVLGSPAAALDGMFAAPAQENAASSARIAIIDDEPINIKVVRRYLALDGFQHFSVTSDSTEAMGLIESTQPDAVLLDIMMPHVSGLDILRQLRADARFIDLPVIILTAAVDRETRLAALDAGATEFLGKPVDAIELKARLANVLRIKAHQDQIKRHACELELEVAIRTTQLMQAHLEVVECLAKAGEYRDTETGNHVLRVGVIAEIIARRMGLDSVFIERIRLAAPLHDIGKLGIPDAILHKPGKLDETEMAIMRRHATFGRQMCVTLPEGPTGLVSHAVAGAEIVSLASSPILQLAGNIAYSHHEKWDGTGYPEGLAGEAIPIEGRITAIADVFDALCSKRPYKSAMPVDDAINFLRSQRGIHFDPAVVDAFLSSLDEILATRSDFADAHEPSAGQGV
jgi:putative two-component system response regulator